MKAAVSHAKGHFSHTPTPGLPSSRAPYGRATPKHARCRKHLVMAYGLGFRCRHCKQVFQGSTDMASLRSRLNQQLCAAANPREPRVRARPHAQLTASYRGKHKVLAANGVFVCLICHTTSRVVGGYKAAKQRFKARRCPGPRRPCTHEDEVLAAKESPLSPGTHH